jgi:pimeloyl-ACP methyl ester carboxylesterase
MEPLVLLPGLLCDQAVWQGQIEALRDVADCTCMNWGHLDSIPAMAERVLQLAPERFSLAGHSMGGRVAFQVVRLAPQRVARLALFNTGVDAKPPGEAGETEERKRRALLQIAKERGMRAMALEWLPGMMKPGRMSDAALVESIVTMIARKTPEIYEAQMLALLGRPDAKPVLPTIGCPTLLLSGREDGWSPPARHEEMAATIPHSRVVIVPDSGHMAPMEQPAAVSAAMREWLRPAVASEPRL